MIYIKVEDVMPKQAGNLKNAGKSFVELYNNVLQKAFGVTLSEINGLKDFPKCNKNTDSFIQDWFLSYFENDLLEVAGLFLNRGFSIDEAIPDGIVAVEEDLILT